MRAATARDVRSAMSVPRQYVPEWSSGPCSALGHDFELRVPREEDFVEVFSAMVSDLRVDHQNLRPACYHLRRRTEPDVDPTNYGLYLGSRCLAAGRTAVDFTTAWSWNLNQAAVAAALPSYVVLHAACVTRAGVTVVMAADMESGKTTTAAGLLRAGYSYVTDEATAIDPITGEVWPFAKPLSLDPGSWALFPGLQHRRLHGSRQWQLSARDLGAEVRSGPVEAPRLVVFPGYQRGARLRIEPVRPAEAVFELARLSFGFTRHPQRILDCHRRTVSGGSSVRLIFGDLEAAVSSIDTLVSNILLEDS